jgi:hypothetical protein
VTLLGTSSAVDRILFISSYSLERFCSSYWLLEGASFFEPSQAVTSFAVKDLSYFVAKNSGLVVTSQELSQRYPQSDQAVDLP